MYVIVIGQSFNTLLLYRRIRRAEKITGDIYWTFFPPRAFKLMLASWIAALTESILVHFSNLGDSQPSFNLWANLIVFPIAAIGLVRMNRILLERAKMAYEKHMDR